MFTPPNIFIDENGQFSEEGWEPPVPPPPFGIYLDQIERKPYRIQIEGYMQEDPTDTSKALLLMFDEEAQKQVLARPGEEKPEAEFKLLSFDIESTMKITISKKPPERLSLSCLRRGGRAIDGALPRLWFYGRHLFHEDASVNIERRCSLTSTAQQGLSSQKYLVNLQ